MAQIATFFIFAMAGIGSLIAISAMLRNNQVAIISALAGRGAFPIITSPEKSPTTLIVARPKPLRMAQSRTNAHLRGPTRLAA